MEENKVLTLASMKVIVDKIKEDYATKQSVDEQIQNVNGANISYATDEEVLALFNDPVQEDEDAGENV